MSSHIKDPVFVQKYMILQMRTARHSHESIAATRTAPSLVDEGKLVADQIRGIALHSALPLQKHKPRSLERSCSRRYDD